MLKKYNFDVHYMQYFIKPKNFMPGDIRKIFFWQRHKKINIKTVINLFKNEAVGIHLHTSVDPGQEYLKPTQEQEKIYNITYSKWFDTKEDLINCTKEMGIFIAPRFEEGIGMSFLEAMAQGKLVVAHNDATMNEYIKDGFNGILRNFKFPFKHIKINEEKFKLIQKNTYEYCTKGYEKWINDRENIIDIIKSPKKNNQLTLAFRIQKLLSNFDRKKIIRIKFGRNANITLFDRFHIGK